ncbi:MAG: HAD family hydrolase [Acidobacteriota bacterium]
MITPECITFDLDDTLWDHRRAQAEALADTASAVVGKAAVAQFVERFHLHNQALWAAYRDGKVEAREVQQLRFARALADLDADPECADELGEAFLERYSRLPYLRTGAREVLEHLSTRVRLGCVTDGFTRAQECKMKVTAIRTHFDFVLTSEQVGAAKPSARLYRAVVEAAGCPAETIVHVGDSYEKDVAGAMAHGLRAVWVPLPGGEERPAGGPAPECTLADLRELPRALGLFGQGR